MDSTNCSEIKFNLNLNDLNFSNLLLSVTPNLLKINDLLIDDIDQVFVKNL